MSAELTRGIMRVPGKTVVAILALWSLALSWSTDDIDSNVLGIDWTGTEAIRSGDCQRAITEILADKSERDTLSRHFRLAVAHTACGNYSKALFLFRLAAEKSAMLSPIAYERIGDIEREQSRPRNALHAYRAVLSDNLPARYKRLIFEKIDLAIGSDTADVARAPWLDEYYKWRAAREKQKVTASPVVALFDSLVAAQQWSRVDSLMDSAQSSFSGADGCRAAQTLSSANIPDSALSTARLFSLALTALSCDKAGDAERWFVAAQKRKDFRTCVDEGRETHFRGRLSYAQGKFDKAIRFYKKYTDKYGVQPDVIMSIARAYRKLDKTAESAEWYDKFIQHFPSDSKTQEVIWLRAWQEEHRGKYDRAGSFYRRIYSTRKAGNRTEESYIRHALTYYRREKFDSAMVLLDTYTRKYQSGNLILAGRYWKAKCYLALDRFDDAHRMFSLVAQQEPSDYYAHRARQVLVLLGDTTANLSIDTLFDTAGARAWLDSISPRTRKTLQPVDSLNYRRGVLLAALGAVDRADCFLESLETSFPGNLDLQFELATLYRIAGAPAYAYRVARRLAWRIPQENRGDLPLAVYALLYPRFFADIINGESDYFNIDPLLVSALIRQESIFNPTIVSPAGAVGLMQIMPFTGEYIAKKLGVNFTVDSLYGPVPNIKFGTYYIRELLDQFSDNIVLVLAGYNGGPHNAKKWYERNKEEEFDLFVEDIEFSETRGYVKKVLANYWTYRTLSQIPALAQK